MRTLRQGDRGEDVRELQHLLAAAGFVTACDGIFGKNTAEMVRQYQAEHGLLVDAIAGPKTLASLRGEMLDDTDPAIVLEIWGVDVSEFQPVVPWAALKAAGCSFAIPRGMTGADKHGEMREDRYARHHAAGARAAGIEVPGFYGWMSEMRSGASQADLFLALGLPGFLALDYEPGPGRQTFRDPPRARAEGTSFIEAVERAGKRCPIYTAPYAAPFPPAWGLRPLWLAHPPDPHAPKTWRPPPAPWGTVAVWQPGLVDKAAAKITLDVDLNIFRGTLADLRALGGS